MDKLPDPFNMAEIYGRAEDKTPYVIVALQECERYDPWLSLIFNCDLTIKLFLKLTSFYPNWLINRRMNMLTIEIRRSLRELDLGLKGELTITPEMEDLGNALFFDQRKPFLILP